MEWTDDGKGNMVVDLGMLTLAAYSSREGEQCFRVMVKRGGDLDQLVWGSSRSRAAAQKDAETAAREAVLRGLLADDGSTDAMLTRLALFSPVTGAELELLIRRTREWASVTCREIAEEEIARIADASDRATDRIRLAARAEVSRQRNEIIDRALSFAIAMTAATLMTAIAWMVIG